MFFCFTARIGLAHELQIRQRVPCLQLLVLIMGAATHRPPGDHSVRLLLLLLLRSPLCESHDLHGSAIVCKQHLFLRLIQNT